MREIRMLRVMWRELETGSRSSLAGHEGGNPGYRQGTFYRVTAPALDPTNLDDQDLPIESWQDRGFHYQVSYQAQF